MPRPKGVKESKPRAGRAGRKPYISYADRYRDDPDGSTDILLRNVPNSTLEYIERQAQTDGMSIQEWIRTRLTTEAIENTQFL